MLHKIGIYVRVSTEEQAQVVDGSIESQQYRLKSFVELKKVQDNHWGKVVETYIDDGYSAKDTRRPAYQRMMKDIRAGKVNLILVTDISRLSRNIHDFCVLLKDLEDRKAKFFSVKEQFDTSTPAGEMMIYSMINMAQFERKQTSERVSLNFHSRALRGLLNGGNPMLGYDKDPTNTGKLLVNSTEAKMVKTIFQSYLDTSSLQGAAKILNDTDIRAKVAPGRKCRHIAAGRWTGGSVRSHLTNMAYIGKREVNRLQKNEEQESLKSWQRHQVVNASWPAILDEDTFYSVQKLLQENREKERTRLKGAKPRFFLLSGILRCGECGRALIGQASHGRNKAHRYYGHKAVMGETISCKLKRFRAGEIESAVIEHLDEMLLRSGYLNTVEENIRKILGVQGEDSLAERDRVEKELVSLDRDIDSAFRLHSEMDKNPDILPLIREKLEKLAERKRKLGFFRDQILTKIDHNNDAKEARTVIEDRALAFKKGWSKASPVIQKRLIRRLVDRLIYTHEGLHTYYVTAKESALTLPTSKEKMASESNSGAIPNNLFVLPEYHSRATGFFSSNGASVVRNGGGAGN